MNHHVIQLEADIASIKKDIMKELIWLSDGALMIILFSLACYSYNWFRYIPCVMVILAAGFFIAVDLKTDLLEDLRLYKQYNQRIKDVVVRSVLES